MEYNIKGRRRKEHNERKVFQQKNELIPLMKADFVWIRN